MPRELKVIAWSFPGAADRAINCTTTSLCPAGFVVMRFIAWWFVVMRFIAWSSAAAADRAINCTTTSRYPTRFVVMRFIAWWFVVMRFIAWSSRPCNKLHDYEPVPRVVCSHAIHRMVFPTVQ